MPELPEVETVKLGLTPKIEGASITGVYLSGLNLRYPLPENYTEMLIGAQIHSVARRAKYLLIYLDNGKILLFHLGMSGSLTFRSEKKKHDHIVLHLKNKVYDDITITYNDPRRFGFSDIIDTHHLDEHKYFKHLGLEPLEKSFHSTYLMSQIKNRKVPIKQAIMDNKIVVGVGNIYACESLFLSAIHPMTLCTHITSKECALLVKMIQKTLKVAIKAGGSSLKDHRTAEGTLGYFQHTFKVYGRDGSACTVCGCTIISQKIAGRNSFFCPKCQPLKVSYS